jgi:hypothetical protein
MKIKFERQRKLKNGDSRLQFKLNKKDIKSLFNIAIKSKVLDLNDLNYQHIGNTKSFIDVVVSAYVLHIIKKGLNLLGEE